MKNLIDQEDLLEKFKTEISKRDLNLNDFLEINNKLLISGNSISIYINTYESLSEEEWGNLSAKIIERAKQNSDISLLWMAAILYSHSLGIEENDQEAFKYFKIAADEDHVDSAYEVALMYKKGIGVERNIEEAFKYSYKIRNEPGKAKALAKDIIYNKDNLKDALLLKYILQVVANTISEESEANQKLKSSILEIVENRKITDIKAAKKLCDFIESSSFRDMFSDLGETDIVKQNDLKNSITQYIKEEVRVLINKNSISNALEKFNNSIFPKVVADIVAENVVRLDASKTLWYDKICKPINAKNNEANRSR